MTSISRVSVTDAAVRVIEQLQAEYGDLMFHQSGGCCDGSAPMCFQLGDFRIGTADVLLGHIHGCPFWMSEDQYEYWKHTHLTVDVTAGRGGGFSLEIPMGIRFLIRSRLLTEAELTGLETPANGAQ